MYLELNTHDIFNVSLRAEVRPYCRLYLPEKLINTIFDTNLISTCTCDDLITR